MHSSFDQALLLICCRSMLLQKTPPQARWGGGAHTAQQRSKVAAHLQNSANVALTHLHHLYQEGYTLSAYLIVQIKRQGGLWTS